MYVFEAAENFNVSLVKEVPHETRRLQLFPMEWDIIQNFQDCFFPESLVLLLGLTDSLQSCVVPSKRKSKQSVLWKDFISEKDIFSLLCMLHTEGVWVSSWCTGV